MTSTFLQTAAVNAGRASRQVDVSAVEFILPILAFLIVVVVLAAVLQKSKVLGDSAWVSIFVSLFTATIFISVDGLRDLVLTVIPWFAVLFVLLFLMLTLGGMINDESYRAVWFGWIFVAILGVVFVIAAIKVFSGTLFSYVPGPYYGFGADPGLLLFFDWFYSPPVIGAFWLIVAAVVVSIILIKSGK
jgi:hypothetical protein